MAFKGTDKIGTKNWPAEKVALAEVERRYRAYDYERRKEVGSDPKKVEQLRKAWEAAVKKAQQYVIPNEFDEILTRNGAQGLNAMTTIESTLYYVELPANRAELWFVMEADRMAHPVFR